MLTIIATMKVKAGEIDVFKKAIEPALEPTREEAGCVDYVLHQDNEDPHVFVLYENWKTAEDWYEHKQTAHFLAYVEAANDILEDKSVQQLTILD